jgi:aminopeptidase N
MLAQLKSNIGNLSTTDRLGIIRDLFALAEGGYIETTEALDFSLAYKNETEYIVWSELASGINRIYHIIGEESFKEHCKKYALSLFSPLAEKLGWVPLKDEHHSHTFLRSLTLSHAGAYGDVKVIKKAQELFKNMPARLNNRSGGNKKTIHADIRGVVYGIVARNGGEKEWKQFEKLYKTEKMHEEQERYGRALAQFENKKLLAKTLEFAMSKNVRQQDASFILSAVWSNSYGRDITWKFMKKNWKTFLKKYGEGGHFLGRILTPLGSHIKAKDAVDAQKFFKTHQAPGADRTLEQSYERIFSNSAWLASDKKSIKSWLKKYK